MQVESYGSVWLFDETEMHYCRVPKSEGPRLPGPNGEDWGGPGAQPGMQDLVWHPYVEIGYRAQPSDKWPYRLVIYRDGGEISPPLWEPEAARLRELLGETA